MSVETENVRFDGERGAVGVDLELKGAIVARAGARHGRVLLPDGSTLADAIEAWGDDYGRHVRFALLEGDRLRSDLHAFRISDGNNERVVASQRVADGDTIRFEFRD
jgi:hypothetical protein